jgi:hypothetical protein
VVDCFHYQQRVSLNSTSIYLSVLTTLVTGVTGRAVARRLLAFLVIQQCRLGSDAVVHQGEIVDGLDPFIIQHKDFFQIL